MIDMINLIIDLLQNEVSKRTGYPHDIDLSVNLGNIIIKLTNRVTHESHRIQYCGLDNFRYQLDECLGGAYRHDNNAGEPTTLKSVLVCEHCKHIFDEKVMVEYFSNNPSQGIRLRQYAFTPGHCPRCGRYVESVEICSSDKYIEVHHN